MVSTYRVGCFKVVDGMERKSRSEHERRGEGSRDFNALSRVCYLIAAWG
jgi:hypothetical protein